MEITGVTEHFDDTFEDLEENTLDVCNTREETDDVNYELDETTMCLICGLEIKRVDFSLHVDGCEDHTEETSDYNCINCDLVFKTKVELNQHMFLCD